MKNLVCFCFFLFLFSSACAQQDSFQASQYKMENWQAEFAFACAEKQVLELSTKNLLFVIAKPNDECTLKAKEGEKYFPNEHLIAIFKKEGFSLFSSNETWVYNRESKERWTIEKSKTLNGLVALAQVTFLSKEDSEKLEHWCITSFGDIRNPPDGLQKYLN